MRDDQKMLNASVRMLLDNGAITAGPQYEVYVPAFPPNANLTDIHPHKIWPRTGGDMQYAAVRPIDANAHMPELIQVMQILDANADEVTAIPKFTYGDNPRTGAAGTMGGLSMLLAQANIALKDFVVSWDEGVTKPFITALYHWNMRFSSDDTIKGDYDVVAKGASSLVAKEVRGQALSQLAHKAAMNNNVLFDICIASRTLAKCDQIIASIHRNGHVQNAANRLYARQLDALDIPATVKLIRETHSEILINLGAAFINMSVLEACLETGAVYLDTAIHEEPDKVCETPPWYANYEWQRKDRCAEKGLTAILGVGFDPGVVNAYCALAAKRYFDRIDTIDILDVNAGSHGKYFATNFDPEINFREFIKVWTWIDRQWKEYPTHSVKRIYNFPVAGPCPIYLNGHDELHSLSKNIDANSIRFWMGSVRPLRRRRF